MTILFLSSDAEISMKMALSEEPPPKEISTEFDLCIVCQCQRTEKLVNTQYRSFNDSSFGTILECVHTRNKYGNPDYVLITYKSKTTGIVNR